MSSIIPFPKNLVARKDPRSPQHENLTWFGVILCLYWTPFEQCLDAVLGRKRFDPMFDVPAICGVALAIFTVGLATVGTWWAVVPFLAWPLMPVLSFAVWLVGFARIWNGIWSEGW